MKSGLQHLYIALCLLALPGNPGFAWNQEKAPASTSPPLFSVLSEIEVIHDITFVYDESVVDNIQVQLPANYASIPLEELLASIIISNGLSYTHVTDGVFAITLPPLVKHRKAQVRITGTVTNATTGDPLVGADIVLAGLDRGASSDKSGHFEIQVAPGTYTVRASYIGFTAIEEDVIVQAGKTLAVNYALREAVAQFGETVIVLGSRGQRTAVNTPVPVDIITQLEVRESGLPEINQVLSQLAPSFNASHQTISDGTDHVNPASLRGLGPDQVLVLINGKRRHQSALVHVNGTFGRGTVGVDLNAIPKSAIERIEVLRDGAAAQYGSDAIAGVINIILKEQTESVEISVSGGGYNLPANNDRIYENRLDGETLDISANYGIPIGSNGFVNVTTAFMNRARTNRSGTYSGDIFPGITGDDATNAELQRLDLTRDDFSMKIGMGQSVMGGLFYNSRLPLGNNGEFYSFGGVSYRRGAASGFYRLPKNEAGVDLTLYPLGFLPEIHTEISDIALTAGLKGIRSGWIMDANITHGANSFLFNIENTMNASLGETSPTSFNAGTLRFSQSTGNLDAVRYLPTGNLVNTLTFAVGSEFRLERYQIEAGQFESYSLGNGGPIAGVDFDTTSSGAPKSSGAQVFTGFQPSNEVDRYRYSIGGYLDVESDLNDQLLLALALRYENFSDFGTTINLKGSSRWQLAPDFALRGAVSSGFRAPSLHQLWFNNVSVQFVLDADNELVPARVLSTRNGDPVAKAFGIPTLKEETSTNFSGGFTARPMRNLAVTVDAYMINIEDRIVLSSRFGTGNPMIGDDVAEILSPFANEGVSQAQFFLNAVDTRTRGIDVVAAYTQLLGKRTLTMTLSGNVTRTEVWRINVPKTVADKFTAGNLEAVRTTLFNREERNRLEDALPRTKGTFSIRYEDGPFAAITRANFYGSIEYKPVNEGNDETLSAKTLLDLDLSCQLVSGVRFSIGANNLLNTFPDAHRKAANLSFGRFIYSRRVTQFGMNGGYYYSRLSLNL